MRDISSLKERWIYIVILQEWKLALKNHKLFHMACLIYLFNKLEIFFPFLGESWIQVSNTLVFFLNSTITSLLIGCGCLTRLKHVFLYGLIWFFLGGVSYFYLSMSWRVFHFNGSLLKQCQKAFLSISRR